MAVNLKSPDPRMIFPVEGVELGTARAGIRKPGRPGSAACASC